MPIDVHTVTITDRIAAYGLIIRGRGGPIVLAFDFKASPPKLLWKKPGYLARDLERY